MSFIAPKDVTDRVARNYRMRRKVADMIDQVAKEVGANQTFVLERMVEYAYAAWNKKTDKNMFNE